MEYIHFFLIFLQFLTTSLIFFSTNPMHSILFMILLFFEAALVLAVFSLDFFALLFVIVYVGAVAVLFLFVVMLLDIKNEGFRFYTYFVLSLLLNIYSAFFCINFFNKFFYKNIQSIFSNKVISFISLETLDDIYVIAQLLYNHYLCGLLIAGFILLIALIGAILLSYDFSIAKNRGISFRRLSRGSNFIALFQ